MPRPRSDLRPRIIAAARDRFLEDGVDGASLRAIARDAATNIGMIYYYFPSKDDLFLGVVEDVYGRLLDDFAEIFTPEGALEPKLAAMSTRVSQMSTEELAVVRILLREALGQSARIERIVERFQHGHIPMVVGAVMRGVDSGEVTSRQPLPIVLVTLVCATVLPQLIRRMMIERLPELAPMFPDGDAMAKGTLALIFGGIAGPDPPPGEPDP